MTHNICEFRSLLKTKFSVKMFQVRCNFYQLDISTINFKRKKPYIDLMTKLVGSCSCNASLWKANSITVLNINSWGLQASSSIVRDLPRKWDEESGPGHTNAVNLEQNKANYFRPHYCVIFQLVSPVHTKKFENDKNELDLGLCLCEINVQ